MKMAKKTLVLGMILAQLVQIRTAKVFFKNLVSSVTRCHGQLSSGTISEKANHPILRKFSDGRTDGQTVKSDFIRRCLPNVERPKSCIVLTSILILLFNN